MRKHDTLVTIQRKDITGQDPVYGTQLYGWVQLGEQEWAEVQDMLPSRGERISDGIDISRRPARIRMRYRDDVTTNMRILVDGRTLEIVSGPAELGRRERIELIAEELSTASETVAAPEVWQLDFSNPANSGLLALF